MKAIFEGLSDYGYEELLECDYSEEVVEELRRREGDSCEISIDCLVDKDDFKLNYYNAKFGDGFEVCALSGMYFSEE